MLAAGARTGRPWARGLYRCHKNDGTEFVSAH
jgi:hypothetical protein